MQSERTKPTITAFAKSPDGGRGLARDMRVRWALEEVGQPYDVRLVTFDELTLPAYRELHPFGQIPVYQEGNLTLFESGAIVFHIADSHRGLLPDSANGRSRALMWMFAALNTVELPIFERSTVLLTEREEDWSPKRLPAIEERVRARLSELAKQLGPSEWLGDSFTAGDLLMIAVLRRLNGSSLLAEQETLSAYVARGEARPAFQRAFAAQEKVFLESREST